jgi:hypothetical protein
MRRADRIYLLSAILSAVLVALAWWQFEIDSPRWVPGVCWLVLAALIGRSWLGKNGDH